MSCNSSNLTRFLAVLLFVGIQDVFAQPPACFAGTYVGTHICYDYGDCGNCEPEPVTVFIAQIGDSLTIHYMVGDFCPSEISRFRYEGVVTGNAVTALGYAVCSNLTDLLLTGVLDGDTLSGTAFWQNDCPGGCFFDYTIVRSEEECGSLSIISPVENDSLFPGTVHPVLWASEGVETVRLEFSDDDGAAYSLIAGNLPANQNIYDWEVPPTPSESCRIRVVSEQNSALSSVSGRFLITEVMVSLEAPQGDSLHLVSSTDTIRWTASGLDSVDILFTADARNPDHGWDALAFGYPAAAGSFPWTVPDELSRHCVVRVQDAFNPAVGATSDTFRVKDYELTRIDENDQYEPFIIWEDSWLFGNVAGTMWPESWWQEFDYENGIDPFTGGTYPDEFTAWPLMARPQDFPDWPLFTDVFGTNQCYWELAGFHAYSPLAQRYWMFKKSNWGGSCFGLAAGCLQAFDDKIEFLQRYPGVSDYEELYDLLADDPLRLVINGLFIRQHGEVFRDHRRASFSRPPSETLQAIRAMLLSEERDDSFLIFESQDPLSSGAHAVVPWRVIPHETQENTFWIYVYDNNHPGNLTKRIAVDVEQELWTYIEFPTWGGNNGLYLSEPVSNYYNPAVIPMNPEIRHQQLRTPVAGDGFIEFHHSQGHDVELIGNEGLRIGYVAGEVINEIAGGLPSVPITGYPHPPMGYEVPEGSFRAVLSAFSDTLIHFAATMDSLTYIYGRGDASAEESDIIYSDTGMCIVHPGGVQRQVNLAAMHRSSDFERVVDVLSLQLSAQDSLEAVLDGNGTYRLSAFGSKTVYNLQLEGISSAGRERFLHEDITLPANSTHLITPDWIDLGATLTIYVDEGHDGTIDDSTVVDNLVGFAEPLDAVEELPKKFVLEQNYPNPFNPTTTISYQLATAGTVSLVVYDILGNQVKQLAIGNRQSAGHHSVTWDGNNEAGEQAASGVYFYKLTASGSQPPAYGKSAPYFVETRKMILLR